MKENGGRVRTFIDKDDNLYAWNAHYGTHEGVASGLGLKIKNWGNEWFTSKGKMYPTGDIKEGYPDWLKEGRLLSDTKGAVAGQVGHQIEKGPFYSQLERTVQQAKINLATPEQWLGYLKNQPGVKADELSAVLGNMPKEGMLSKGQLEDIVKANKVELKEKVLSGEIKKGWLERGEDINAPTKYHQYQLPGGENYKETLLSLPGNPEKKALINRNNEIQVRREQIQDEFDALHGQSGKDIDTKRLHLAKEQVDLMDESKSLARKLDDVENTGYKAPHFGEHGEDLMAHVRTNERELPGIGRGTHIEELQSDHAQNIRDKGFKGEKEKLQPEFDKVEAKLMATNDDKLLGLPTVKDVLAKAVEDGHITKTEANTYKRYTDIENASPAPDMPFKKNWDEVLIKKTIYDAVQKGHKFISVTPGEAQALRYQNEIRQKIDNIRWIPREGKAGELRALVTVEDFRLAVAAQGLLQTVIAKHRLHAVADPPAQHFA